MLSIFSIAGYLHAVYYYDLGRYVSGPGIGNFKQVQVAKCGDFWTEKIPFLATSRFCHYWQILSPDAL